MTEWLKVLAWKAGVPQKGTEGSNPSLSAITIYDPDMIVLVDELKPNFENKIFDSNYLI